MPSFEICLRFRDLALSLCTTDASLADRTTVVAEEAWQALSWNACQ
jgi:hypothetical protein